MSAPRGISRREFVKSGAMAGAGLILAARAGTVLAWSAHEGGNGPGFSPSVYLRIQPDNQIFYWVTRSEMGQGVRTTLPMILAEELEADYRSLQLVQAPTIPAFKGIRLRTSGSGSSVGTARALRQAGATAREMLITAAANNWVVDRKECRAESGFVVHGESGGRFSYGELALSAAKLEVPKDVPLKAFKDFKLIGKPVRRFDGPATVQGQARYGFDVRQPGMRFAAIARCPYLGGKALRWDASKATAVPGVHEIIPVTTGIATGVAVTADNSWAAFRGCDLLQVIWDPGPHAKFSSED